MKRTTEYMLDAGLVPELRAEIERLKADCATATEVERLRHIEQAAQRAFDYHLMGYGPHTEDFDANTQLALMDELGKALKGK